MNQLGLIMALLGAALVSATWLHYLAQIPAARLSVRVLGHRFAMAAGMLAGLAAIPLALLADAGVAGALVLAPWSLGAGGFFFWLLTQASLPAGELQVAVGDPLPSFAAWTHTGEPFDTAKLSGQRVLLKFFRGHW